MSSNESAARGKQARSRRSIWPPPEIGGRGWASTRAEIANEVGRGARAVLAELERWAREGTVRPEVASALRADYEAQAAAAEAGMEALHRRATDLLEDEQRAARRQSLLVEKANLLESAQRGLIGQEALDELLADVDARLYRLEAGEDQSPGGPERAAPAPAPRS